MFDIGFELEFITDLSKPQVQKALKDYLGNYPWVKNISVVSDASVTGGWEIVTPPWKDTIAVSRLYQLLEFIQVHGKTTKATGLHINISFSDSRSQRKVNYYTLVNVFPEAEVLKLFKRTQNEYCLPTKKAEFYMDEDILIERLLEATSNIMAQGNLTSMERMIQTKKFKATIVKAVAEAIEESFNYTMDDKYVGIHQQDGYYEFRVVGNANYEFRGRDIAKVLNKIKMSMKKALTKSKKTVSR